MPEQVDAWRRLWPHGEPMMQQAPARTCGSMERGAYAGEGLLEGLVIPWGTHAAAACSWRTASHGRDPCWGSLWRAAARRKDSRWRNLWRTVSRERDLTLQPRKSRSAPRIMTASAKKKRRVIVIGNYLLQGTEGQICWPYHREVCCLPGAWDTDVARKLPGLVRTSDCYPLLVMQVGEDEIVERSPKAIKRDFRALGWLAEGSGVQVMFSSIPSVAGKSTEKTHLINRWLRNWCHRWNFGFFDQGEVYMARGLLATDRVQLSQRENRILGHELVRLIESALN